MESLDEEQRKKLVEMYPKQKLESLSAEQLLDLLHPPENSHVIVAPLAEVVSIRIEITENPDSQHKISGTIQITDGEGNTFHFYNREDDNPETIPSGGTLTLTVPKDHIIVPSNVIKVDFNLKDADNNVEIIKGIFNWNCMTKAGYDEINAAVFKGKCGSAVLDYVTFYHAVIARVAIKLRRRKGDSDGTSGVKMYGEIIARYGGNLSSILFDKNRGESVIQEYESYIELSRHVFIVPALSPLEIYVKLFDGDTRRQIVEDKIEFNAIRYPTLQDILKGQSGVLQVEFKSSHPYMQPPMGRRVQRTNHFLEERPSSAMSINRNLQSPFGMKLFEFYSISIGEGNGKDVNLWGSIKVLFDDGHSHVFLFNKDKSSSHNLLPYETIPMTSYTDCLAMLAICVGMTLRDDKARLISSGYMSWGELKCERYKSLFNRQLCSIIRGSDGCYGAIHYAIFDAGVQAMVNIYLNKKTTMMEYVKIGGSICAGHGGFDYSIPYHKKYYRRRLFSTKLTESWMHCPDSDVILSQSSVMVPLGSSLILDVDIEVTAKEATDCVSQVINSFKELLEFKVDMLTPETMTKKIDGSSHHITINVEWKSVL